MRALMVPAILPVSLRNVWTERPMHWLVAEGEEWDQAALVSYYHWQRDRADFPGAFIFGDSGGFSVATTNAPVDPIAALRWQVENCDVGVILDIPPYRRLGSKVFRLSGSAAEVWDESLNRTLQNVRAALPHLPSPETTKFRWWGVVQGESYDQMRQWFEAVSEVYPFEQEGEGWAFKPHPSNDLLAVAQTFRLVKEQGIKRVHLLQSTGSFTLGVAFALAKLSGVEFLTFDSAAPSNRGWNRQLEKPSNDPFVQIMIRERPRHGGERLAEKYMRNVCTCQSCIWLREDEEEWGERHKDHEYYKYRIIFHNHIQSFRRVRLVLEGAERNPEEMLRRSTGAALGAVMRVFSGARDLRAGMKRVSIFDRL